MTDTATETIEQPQSLAEYKAERLAAPKAEEVTPAPAPEAQAEPEAKQEEPEKPKKPKLEQRFSELTQARKAAEERAAAAEARARELEAKLAPAPATKAEPVDGEIGPEPKPTDYTDAFEYASDLAQWRVDKALKDRDVKEAKAREEAERGKVLQSWQTRLESAKAEIPDFEDMVASSELTVSDVVRDTIIESEFGPKILYHFAADDEAAQKLNSMTVKQALMHIAKLEAKFEQAAEKRDTPTPVEKPTKRPPAPITPVKSASVSVDPVTDPSDNFTYAQWKAARMARRI